MGVGRETYYHGYTIHSCNQLVWSANFDGQSALAMQAAEAIIWSTPKALARSGASFIEPLFADLWYVMVRFGKWAAILERETPAEGLYVSHATALWAKSVACGALGRVDDALSYESDFLAATKKVPRDRRVHMVASILTLDVAAVMLRGELLYRQGRFDEAFATLREAVRLEVDLPYDEPWGWMTPVAHALGALLLEQGRRSEAEAVYRGDLERWPDNMWSLHGLIKALRPSKEEGSAACCSMVARAEGQAEEVMRLEAILAKASARSDIDLQYSCYCAGMHNGPYDRARVGKREPNEQARVTGLGS